MKNTELVNQYSEMTREEREFILETIKKYSPKKIITVGIAAGANEVIILDYLEKNNLLNETKFFSIDYNTVYIRDLNSNKIYKRPTGFLVNECIPHLKQYWTLYTPGLTALHIDKIGSNIDLCILDTVHSAPGELFDILMILPYLSNNAVIIFHDLIFHCANKRKYSNICALVFLILKGEKSYPKQLYRTYTKTEMNLSLNIGACKLENKHNIIDDLFRSLSLPWCYIPNENDLNIFKSFIKKHYSQNYFDFVCEVIESQKYWADTAQNIKIQKQELENLPFLKQKQELENLRLDANVKKLKIKKLEKELGLKLSKLEPHVNLILSENLRSSAVARMRNHLTYKRGEALIVCSKSFLGLLSLPFVLNFIEKKHKKEQAAYEKLVKDNSHLAFVDIEYCNDYKEALKVKQCFTYQLGLAFVKARKTWYKGGFIKFYFEAKRLYKQCKENEKREANELDI